MTRPITIGAVLTTFLVAATIIAINLITVQREIRDEMERHVGTHIRTLWHVLQDTGSTFHQTPDGLMLGTVSLENNQAITDHMHHLTSEGVGIFRHDRLIAFSPRPTGLKQGLGASALPSDIYERLRQGQPYRGRLELFDADHIVALDPIQDASGETIGALLAAVRPTDASGRFQSLMTVNLLVTITAAIALTMVIQLLLHMRVVHPLNQLWTVMDQLAAGDPRGSIPYTTRTDAIGAMAQSLQRFQADLRQSEMLQIERIRQEVELIQTREQLSIALEAIDDCFALFDSEERLVLCNQRYRQWISPNDDKIYPGMRFEDLLSTAWNQGIFNTSLDRDSFIQQRLEHFRRGYDATELQLNNGKWFLATERRMSNGGTVAIRSDVTYLKRTQEDLRIALELAETANRSKTAFLSSMSHELRTPLNAILGFAQVLETNQGTTQGPRQRAAIAHIVRGSNLLLGLINDILDFSRIEAGRLEMSPRPINVCDLMHECLDLIADMAAKRELILTVDPPKIPIYANADSLRLRQVFLNILSNAVKYNRYGGKIHTSGQHLGNQRARIAVRDTGPGIPKPLHDRVFDPFDRLGAETSPIEGTGIGLTITRKLVELMGGRIGFDSVAGEGTTFWIELPTLNAPDSPDPTRLFHPRKIKVLYVENNALNLKVIESLDLGDHDLEIRCALSGEDGLALLADEQIDILFLDWDAGDAESTLAQARNRPGGDNMAVFALSRQAEAIAFDQMILLGLQQCLSKPLPMAQLRSLIRDTANRLAGNIGAP